MIVYNCTQGSQDWHQARTGCITASKFKITRASAKLKSGANKGDYNEAAKNYAFRLAIERISGAPLDEGFETWQMKRGHELESQARMEHEIQSGLIVETCGFLQTDDGWFGASADGLIGEDEGSEYKCLVSPEELRVVLLNDDTSEFTDQIQGCLWLTGRKRWHFCLYCPAMESIGAQLYWRVINRDEAYIEALQDDLMAFRGLVSGYESKLRKLTK